MMKQAMDSFKLYSHTRSGSLAMRYHEALICFKVMLPFAALKTRQKIHANITLYISMYGIKVQIPTLQ